jgi:hypothetical protein
MKLLQKNSQNQDLKVAECLNFDCQDFLDSCEDWIPDETVDDKYPKNHKNQSSDCFPSRKDSKTPVSNRNSCHFGRETDI